MLAALANVLRIPELRTKVVFTLAMFCVFRAGIHIPVPGVNTAIIEQMFNTGNLLGLLDLFSGGALSKFSIFAMSITPYINASIIMQLLTVVVPQFEQWSKEGEEGRKKISQITRYGTVVLGFIQALGMAFGLKHAIINPSIGSILLIALTLTAGTVFLMWIGEQITEKGIGNGISLIIFAGIVSRLPDGLFVIYEYLKAGTINILNVVLFVVIAIAMIVFCYCNLTGAPESSGAICEKIGWPENVWWALHSHSSKGQSSRSHSDHFRFVRSYVPCDDRTVCRCWLGKNGGALV